MITEIEWRDAAKDRPIERKTKLLFIPEHDMSITGYRVGNLYYTPLGAFTENRVTMWAELPSKRDFKERYYGRL